jgi:hypothetical protein
MRRLSLACVLVILPALALAAPLQRVQIDTPDARALSRELQQRGYDVLEGSVGDASLEVVVSETELRRLEALGYTVRVIEIGRPFREIQAERQAQGTVPVGYLDLAGLLAHADSLAAAHPAICRVVDLTAELGAPATFQGRHLHAIKVSDNVLQAEDEPAVLVVAAHHCREIVTPVIALHALEQLLAGYGVDPGVTAAVDSHEIWIAPVWNPDGYEYVFSGDNLWRKNRRIFPEAVGVDLNRNYPQGWSNPCSGSTDPSSLTYKGPTPASEAETQTLMAWSGREHFAKVLDFHSRGRETLHAYSCWSHPFDAFLADEATALSDAASYAGSHRSPSADGEHYQWQLAARGAHAFLMETALEFQPPYVDALAEAAQVWPAIRWMLERPVPLWGYVTDASEDTGVLARISFEGVFFWNGELVPTDPGTGRYHAFLPTGTYDVVVEADGYLTQTIPGVTIGADGSVRLDVQLTRDATAVALPGAAEGETGLLASDPIRRTVRFRVDRTVPVTLAIHDVRGALVRSLEEGWLAPGQYERSWDGRDDGGSAVGSGTYFFRLRLGAEVWSGKMVHVR